MSSLRRKIIHPVTIITGYLFLAILTPYCFGPGFYSTITSALLFLIWFGLVFHHQKVVLGARQTLTVLWWFVLLCFHLFLIFIAYVFTYGRFDLNFG